MNPFARRTSIRALCLTIISASCAGCCCGKKARPCTDDSDCWGSTCLRGTCASDEVVHKDRACAASAECTESGLCGAAAPTSILSKTECVAVDDRDCSRSTACKREGRCAVVDSQCSPTVDAHCAASDGCRSQGRCHHARGRCVTADRDCVATDACRLHNLCRADGEKCVEGWPESGRCAYIGVAEGGEKPPAFNIIPLREFRSLRLPTDEPATALACTLRGPSFSGDDTDLRAEVRLDDACATEFYAGDDKHELAFVLPAMPAKKDPEIWVRMQDVDIHFHDDLGYLRLPLTGPAPWSRERKGSFMQCQPVGASVAKKKGAAALKASQVALRSLVKVKPDLTSDDFGRGKYDRTLTAKLGVAASWLGWTEPNVRKQLDEVEVLRRGFDERVVKLLLRERDASRPDTFQSVDLVIRARRLGRVCGQDLRARIERTGNRSIRNVDETDCGIEIEIEYRGQESLELPDRGIHASDFLRLHGHAVQRIRAQAVDVRASESTSHQSELTLEHRQRGVVLFVPAEPLALDGESDDEPTLLRLRAFVSFAGRSLRIMRLDD